jgi:hypothetical protein
MDKIKFTLRNFSFLVFLQPTVNRKKNNITKKKNHKQEAVNTKIQFVKSHNFFLHTTLHKALSKKKE